MHPVRAADRERVTVLLGPSSGDRRRAVDAVEDERPRLEDLERERRVEHVRGREAVVEPAAVLAECLADGVDERSHVVLGPLLDLAHVLRGGCACSPDSPAASAGTTPSSAQASSAASSTSSQRSSLRSSDQTPAIAGRE